MGMVFGRTGLTQANGLSPAYEVLGTRSGFELRTYAPYVVAEVIGVEDDREGNNSFKYLAKYIGVFGTPENSNSEAMAMTAPVIKEPTEKIAMTAPVVREASGSGMVMSFVMPQKYTKISQLPAPTDSHVRLREVQQWSYLVKTFNGWVRDDGRKQLAELVGDIKADGTFAEVVDTEAPEKNEWSLAQYQPPFTLPPFRRNEIWIRLPASLTQEKLKEMLGVQEETKAE